MKLRQATEGDAPAIATLHARAWQWAYRGQLPDALLDGLAAPDELSRREAWWRRMLRAAPTDFRVWVADEHGQIVGFASTGASGDSDAAPGVAELGAIYLDPSVVGRGVGRALLAAATRDLRERGFRRATLWVLATNARARRFYEIAGWRPDGTEKVEQLGGVAAREVRYEIDFQDGEPHAPNQS